MAGALDPWAGFYLALAFAAALGASALFVALALAGDKLSISSRVQQVFGAYGLAFILALIGLVPFQRNLSNGALTWTAVLFAAIVVLPLVGALVGSWRLLRTLAATHATTLEAARQEGRDKALERQIRALVREQRALNRRQQEQSHSSDRPPIKPR